MRRTLFLLIVGPWRAAILICLVRGSFSGGLEKRAIIRRHQHPHRCRTFDLPASVKRGP